MQSSTKTVAGSRSWQVFLAAAIAVCLSFGLLGLSTGAAFAAPDSSSSAASESSKASDDSSKASEKDNDAVEHAAKDAAEQTTSFSGLLGNDLMIANDDVSSSGDKVVANLFAFGNGVTLNDQTVGADAFVSGTTINISGMKTASNLFIAGNNITVSGTTGQELFAAGNNLDLSVDVTNANVAGRTVYLKGTFEGNVNITAQSVVIDPYIVVKGALNVTAEQEPSIASTAKIGSFNFTQAQYDDKLNVGDSFASIGSQSWIEGLVKTLISMLLIGIFMLLVLRTEVVDSTGRLVRNRPVAILITGILGLILLPVLGIGLLFTLVCWPISFALFALCLCITVLCIVYTAVALSRAAFPRLNKWVSSIIFIIVFALLMSIPVVMFILAVLCLIFTTGSVIQGWWVWRRGKSLDPESDGGFDDFSVPRGSHYVPDQSAQVTASGMPYSPSTIQPPVTPGQTGRIGE